MKSEFVNPFIEATVETFETMCGVTPVRDGDLRLQKGVFEAYDLVCVVGLSGKVRGAVLLTLPVEVGMKVSGAFLGEEITELNEDLLDAIGELLNIVAGAAAAKLEGYDVRIALPTVLVGKDQMMGGKESSPWVVIPMRFPEYGKFTIEISMEEA